MYRYICIYFVFHSKACHQKSSKEWGLEVNKVANKTLLPTVKHSWYLGANVEGKSRIFMPYVGGFPKYYEKCKEIEKSNYKGFIFT